MQEIVERQWGSYKVLYELPNCKVKELVVQPGKSLSMQRHFKRSEHWHVVDGFGNLKTEYFHPLKTETFNTFLSIGTNIVVPVGVWHQLTNTSNDILKIIEIQYGDECIEEDIERREV
jgi:mannose-6-phosphate isomerase-like protein (cupin superfamily)